MVLNTQAPNTYLIITNILDLYDYALSLDCSFYIVLCLAIHLDVLIKPKYALLQKYILDEYLLVK